jgi:parallel beta-helix repeat protein
VLDDSNDGMVGGNDVRHNVGGIELSSSSGNWLGASDTTGNGIELEESFANVLVLNTVNRNNGQGISVDGGEGNVIEHNTADDNLGDGIVLSNEGHTIVGNTANRNDGWGIYAALGTIDGRGNSASGNAEGAQCFGPVVCSP